MKEPWCRLQGISVSSSKSALQTVLPLKSWGKEKSTNFFAFSILIMFANACPSFWGGIIHLGNFMASFWWIQVWKCFQYLMCTWHLRVRVASCLSSTVLRRANRLSSHRRALQKRKVTVLSSGTPSIPCPRLGVEWIGRISWLPRAHLGPIFMTSLPER